MSNSEGETVFSSDGSSNDGNNGTDGTKNRISLSNATYMTMISIMKNYETIILNELPKETEDKQEILKIQLIELRKKIEELNYVYTGITNILNNL